LEISSPRGVTRHLEALEKKGFIHRGRIARGIRILADTAGELEVWWERESWMEILLLSGNSPRQKTGRS
jgi:SOS-response transcriptional repressor LexA